MEEDDEEFLKEMTIESKSLLIRYTNNILNKISFEDNKLVADELMLYLIKINKKLNEVIRSK